MNRRTRYTLLGRVMIGAAYLVMLLTVAPPSVGQDSGRLEPDDGYFPLTRNEVIELQELLARLGYKVGPIDGVVGPQTVAAAKNLTMWLEREFVRKPSGQEIVLNCEIEEGSKAPYDSTQIMIDEYRGIVIYHFNYTGGNLNPIRVYHSDTGNQYIDLSMKISKKSDDFIVANNDDGAIVITKSDGKFVNAYVSPVPLLDGNWFAFGNTIWGTCAKSPFR